MSLIAFHGETHVRDSALRRLAAHFECKTVAVGLLSWDGQKGSVAGCLAESNDPEVWEARLGLARWIAYALDTVTGPLSPSRAHEEVASTFHTLPLGVDTSLGASRTIVRVLDKIGADEGLVPRLADAMTQVRTLQLRCLSGEEIARSDWRRARRSSLDATDAVAPLPAIDAPPLSPLQVRSRAIGSVVEAAAWDPMHAASAVAEVLRLWLEFLGLDSGRAFGWHESDDQQVGTLLEEMYQKYILPNPTETRDVYQMLEVHNPQAASRLRAYYQHGSEYRADCAERACALMRAVLQELG